MKNVKNKHINRKNSRKGVIEAQFNWIFIMITGTIIFIFIIAIVLSQKHNADQQAGISALKQITTILKGRQQSANVYSEINFPRTNINFRCEANNKLFTFKIDNANRVDLPLEIIFAPQDISTNKMLVWSQKFSIGFPVSTFTYITTTDSIIILYNGTTYDPLDQRIIDLYNELPDNITKKITTDIEEYNKYKRVRVVCIDDLGCPGQWWYPDADYLKITSTSSSLEYGNVTFHKKDSYGDDVTKAYITKAGLYGAIFSDNPAYYDCQMSRALSQFEVKRSLVEKRLTLIQDDLEESTCKTLIDVTLNSLIIPMSNPELKWADVTQMSLNVRNLNVRNEDLRLKSCPKVY